MDDAFAACGFFLLEGAFVEAQKSVFLELLAFWAEFAVGFVVVSAVYFYHVADGFFLSFHSLVFRVGRLGFHFDRL